jgi:hypothetical protein
MCFLCLYFLQHLGKNSIRSCCKRNHISNYVSSKVNGFESAVKCSNTCPDIQLSSEPYDHRELEIKRKKYLEFRERRASNSKYLHC